MEFILQQQAKADERQAKADERLVRFEANVQRTIESMAERQAQFESRMAERQAQFESRLHERQAEFEGRVEKSIDFVLQQQAKTSSEIMQLSTFGAELARGQVRMENALAGLRESHQALAEAQKKTEQHLNAFIGALERRFGGNGKGRRSI